MISRRVSQVVFWRRTIGRLDTTTYFDVQDECDLCVRSWQMPLHTQVIRPAMILENFSSRDKFWFHPIVNLHHRTTSLQMNAVLDRIRSLLKENQQIDPDSVRVQFLGFGSSSLEVEVFAYVLACDWPHFLGIQEQMLLRIMECVDSAGAQIALPTHSIFLAAASKPATTVAEGQVQSIDLNGVDNDQVAAKSA